MSVLSNFMITIREFFKDYKRIVILSIVVIILATIFSNIFIAIRNFFEAGGPVLWGILFVTIIMWTLIVERFWFFNYVLPQRITDISHEWQLRKINRTWSSNMIRNELISQVSVETHRFILTIETMMQILPLLGLLGTVVGMIGVFDVMTFFGTGNARLMASGVSQATIPTMAGLVAALSGLYIANLLKRTADDQVHKLADLLIRE
jgi:biopolymer transport protein ExbB